MAATNGKGVDVVLNSLSGPLLKATWDCVARFGRLVDNTKVDIEANRGLETAPFGRCAVYTSFDLLQLTEYRGNLTHEALVECVRIVRERQAAPVHPITPLSITDMATAMRQMQGGAHMGKVGAGTESWRQSHGKYPLSCYLECEVERLTKCSL